LPGDLQVRQAGGGEGLAWKLALLALDLLQAQDIGRLFVDEAGDLLGPSTSVLGRKSSLSCRDREGIGSGTVCEERVGRSSPCVLNMPLTN
jgi:hypothetical protein